MGAVALQPKMAEGATLFRPTLASAENLVEGRWDTRRELVLFSLRNESREKWFNASRIKAIGRVF
jgi:hypothetical protein